MALGGLEISFIVVVGSMSALAGIFGLYVMVMTFRNTGLRRGRRSS